jgi:hypothetical protein
MHKTSKGERKRVGDDSIVEVIRLRPFLMFQQK